MTFQVFHDLYEPWLQSLHLRFLTLILIITVNQSHLGLHKLLKKPVINKTLVSLVWMINCWGLVVCCWWCRLYFQFSQNRRPEKLLTTKLFVSLIIRDYIKCLLANLEDDRIMLCDLFDKVRDELMKKNPDCSVPIEFSLSSSLFPLRLKTENNEG